MAKDRCDICGGALDGSGKCGSCEGLLSLDLGLDSLDEGSEGGVAAELPEDGGEVDLDATVREVSDEIDLIMDAFKMDKPKAPDISALEAEHGEPDLGETEDAQLSQEALDSAPLEVAEPPPPEDAPDGSLEGAFAKAADEVKAPAEPEDLGVVADYVESKEAGQDISEVAPLPDEPEAPAEAAGVTGRVEAEEEASQPSGAAAAAVAATTFAAVPASQESAEPSAGQAPGSTTVQETAPVAAASQDAKPEGAAQKGSGLGAAIAIILGILIVPVGFLVLAFSNFALGGALAVVGFLIIGVGVALYLIGRRRK